MSEFRLAAEIVARTVADVWDRAKLEWALHESGGSASVSQRTHG